MNRNRMRLVPTFAALILLVASPLRAQDSALRVMRHTPGDTASPGNVVTVTFDRPVAGGLDRTVEAARIFHIEPSVAGQVVWRDPITIRFIPDEPLPPGATFTVTVDTAFRALDGSRLAQPYRYSFRVPGPRLLAHSFGGDYRSDPGVLPVQGPLQLLYSAPVDLDQLGRGLRLELTACAGGPIQIAMRPVRQRAVETDDPYWIRSAGGWYRDTSGDRFRRVVDLEPARPLPPECAGQLVLPTTSEDSVHGREERFAVQTAPRFRIHAFDCSRGRACALNNLVLSFTAPVKREDILRHVHLEPSMPLVLDASVTQAKQWLLARKLVPRSTYTVVVDNGLRDVYGRALVGSHRERVVTGDYLPSISYAHGRLTIPRTGPHTIPLRHVNVSTIRIVSYRIPDSERARILVTPTWYFASRSVDPPRLRPETTLVKLRGTFNVETTTELPLPAIATPSGGSLVVLRLEIATELTGPQPGDVRPAPPPKNKEDWFSAQPALVQLSDLAVHAKLGPGQGMVLVTGVTDGRPRAGARVRQLDPEGRVVAEGMTGPDGMAHLRLPDSGVDEHRDAKMPISDDWPPHVGLIEAELGNDRVITPLMLRAIGFYNANPLNPAWLGARVEEMPHADAIIFADRAIYRPGEMLYLGGIVRRGVLGALELPAAHDSVRVTVRYQPHEWETDEDVVVRDTVLRLTDLGTVTDSLRLRTGIPLGSYAVALYVTVGESWRVAATKKVRVAEYRAPEFLLDMRADSTPRYGGDTIHVQAAGRYLFGAPMTRAKVQWSAALREAKPWEVHIPGADGWTVGEWDWWSPRDEADTMPQRLSGLDSLDTAGHLDIRVPVEGLRPSMPGRVEVQAAVMDVNRQVATASTSVAVHPARLYILARQGGPGWMWTAHARAAVEIRTVRPDGATVRGVPVVVSVVHLVWTNSSRPGSYAQHWTEDTVRTDTVRTGDRPVRYSVVPQTGGYYVLHLAASDGHGGIARTTLGAYAAGAGATWWSRTPYRLTLVADQRELAVGDTAHVAFDSPFDHADAWVTIERERVFEERHITVHRGRNVIPLRITERHVPNVFVSVFLLRRTRGPAPRPDSASQLLRAGYTELRVKTTSKRLAVTVDPALTEYGPGDTAVVHVRVHDASGRGARGEVTVWGVDQGVLALTGFQTPDVLAHLYTPRGVGAGLWSTLPTILTSDPGLVVTLLGLSSVSLQEAVVTSVSMKGQFSINARMSSPLANMPLRSWFRSTAFYVGAVNTDSEGRATVRVGLPDNLTTYRVMAVAVSGADEFGSGDTTLLVTRPLVARPSLPRFVRAGDSLLAGAVVNARDGRARPVIVEASSNGIALRGPSRREIMLAEGKGAEARFSFSVPPRDSVRDTVLVRLRASDGTDGDGVEVQLPVRPDFHPRAHTELGAVRDAADVVMTLPADIDPARSRLSMRLGTSPLAPMLSAYDWLRVYPYYCTEQISSLGRALVAIWRATRDRDSTALGGDPRPRLQELTDALARRQRPDGAIRYWDDYDWSSPWLSAYAGLFLLDARDAGISVSDVTINRLAEYLGTSVALPIDTGGMNRTERRSRRLALGNRVAAVEFLRRVDKPNVHVEDALLRLAPLMTWEDRLRLAEVLAPRADVRAQVLALVDAAWRAVTPAGNRVDLPDSAHADRAFPSRIAPAARLLTASLALRPEHPLLGGLIETVLQQGRAERGWAWSTQDYASVVIALAALDDSARTEREVRVMSGARLVFARRIGDADSSATVPLTGLLERRSDGSTELHLRVTATSGRTPIYYAVTVEEVPSKAPVTPDNQGIVVERWYERFDDGRPVTTVQAGDLVRVRLRVTVPADREFVAVEDPLPAGLEPVDLSLRTSATLQPFVTPGSERARIQGDRNRDGPRWQAWLYGRWDDGWWSPWEHTAMHDDRVVYFARMLWAGSYTASYVARATTAGTFVRPPAHAEEMYNPALQGRSDGGVFGVASHGP